MPDSLFNALATCPLTGLPIKGSAVFSPYRGNNKLVLYEFAPIGKAIFDFNFLIGLYHSTVAGNHAPSSKLAGLCREASEKGQEPFHITSQAFHDAQGTSESLQEKRDHLLQVLYDVDVPAYKTRDINIHNDFPLAAAKDEVEFHLILEECVRRGLLEYDKPNDTLNEWPYGRRTHYFDVHLTEAGEKAAANRIRPHQLTTSVMTHEDIVRRQAQVAFDKATAQRYPFNTPNGLSETRRILIAGTHQFHEKSEKKLYLQEVVQLLNTELAAHKLKCTFQGKIEACPIDLGMHETIYFIQQEEKRLDKVEAAFPFQTSQIFNFGDNSTNAVSTGANSVQTTNTGQGAQVNVASGDSVKQVISGTQLQQLKELVKQLREILATETFATQREDIDDQLQVVDAQLQRSEPKKGILLRSLDALQELTKESVGSIGGHAAFEIFKQLAEQLSSAG
ncbi:hypothetical protein [Hymenobacter sublimis]|uniref:Uncharacterized protein n=1 Tax=Hymenobacter sublimis TaxID=2933777 RepID=A0ABY4JEU7_9BACT|nr:hypothetical protein [Hymenobacter sublimis]UPL51353.1 hypothetical protein MWH26_20015 [Hymenobacter sublimis]